MSSAGTKAWFIQFQEEIQGNIPLWGMRKGHQTIPECKII